MELKDSKTKDNLRGPPFIIMSPKQIEDTHTLP